MTGSGGPQVRVVQLYSTLEAQFGGVSPLMRRSQPGEPVYSHRHLCGGSHAARSSRRPFRRKYGDMPWAAPLGTPVAAFIPTTAADRSGRRGVAWRLPPMRVHCVPGDCSTAGASVPAGQVRPLGERACPAFFVDLPEICRDTGDVILCAPHVSRGHKRPAQECTAFVGGTKSRLNRCRRGRG